MAVRVVGAGLARTGTSSLKLALERLLDGRCYHMYELIERPQDTASWESAVAGEPVELELTAERIPRHGQLPRGPFLAGDPRDEP